MDLFLCDMTFREIAGEESPFPESLRRMILQSVQRVPIEDMEQLLERHEADPDTFDRRIESYLREALSPDVRIHAYVQRKQLILDVKMSNEEAESLRLQGLRVVPRNNYQAKNGWLAGVMVPHDTDKLDIIVGLACAALTGFGDQPFR